MSSSSPNRSTDEDHQQHLLNADFEGGSFFEEQEEEPAPAMSPPAAATSSTASGVSFGGGGADGETTNNDSMLVVGGSAGAEEASSNTADEGSTGRGGGGDATTFDTSILTVYDDSAAADFEERIRHYTKVRRERQETTLSELSVKVGRLEAALAAESRRRVSAVRELEKKMKEEVEQVETRISAAVHDNQVHVDERMVALEGRIADLESRWEHDVEDVRIEIDKQADSLKASIADLEEKLTAERIAQERRQGELLGQLKQVSGLYESKWTTERQERLDSANGLNHRLDAQDMVRDEQLRVFEVSITTELRLLEDELRKETEERQLQDEQIVAGLNRYINQVQKSLSYVSEV